MCFVLNKICLSRSHVWSHFCLSFKGQKLIDDKTYIRFLGIRDDDQVSLHFHALFIYVFIYFLFSPYISMLLRFLNVKCPKSNVYHYTHELNADRVNKKMYVGLCKQITSQIHIFSSVCDIILLIHQWLAWGTRIFQLSYIEEKKILHKF